MDNQSAQNLAILFLFDLQNSAKEHWFKPGEIWELSIADTKEKAALEKGYHPVLSAAGPPKEIEEIYDLVEHQLYPEKKSAIRVKKYKDTDTIYIVAYNPIRMRK